MYEYSDFDEAFVRNRVAQFRAQVDRRLSGELTEDQFRPLRLMNGLYLQLHAYMMRVAIPYGTLSARQMRQLAMIADRWDRGYGHFTTRQNIQFNWLKLVDAGDVLSALADVGMHAIQTSGNTIRNTTTDAFAGAAADEIEDPRPWAELIRQWSTDHPEFQFLPRKFKIAITGSPEDRAAIHAHDIGLMIVEQGGQRGFRVIAGGGLGRTPTVGPVIRDFLPAADLLPYLEAILAAYNSLGRRDNKYKARIKITVAEAGLEVFRAAVEAEFPARRAVFTGVDQQVLAGLRATFALPDLPPRHVEIYARHLASDHSFAAWSAQSVTAHKRAGYGIVTVSLKPHGGVPGDATSDQMRALADLAERYSRSELRISHMQNVVLPHVALDDLPALHAALARAGLATANIGLASDIIACPGMDYCSLATARSIPVAQGIATALAAREAEVGPLAIKISGCINACGHHHIGDIGILGLDRAGVENYQITLGGRSGPEMVIGDKTGPGFPYDQVVPAVERLVAAYLDSRSPGETFAQTLRRTGPAPFHAALYPESKRDAA